MSDDERKKQQDAAAAAALPNLQQEPLLTLTTPQMFILDVTSSNQKKEWTRWRQGLELYFSASNIKSSERKKALLLYLAGEDIRNIYNALDGSEKDTYQDCVGLIDDYFNTRVNLTYERNKFRNIVPQPGENSKSFITRLKEASINCGFENYSSGDAIVDQFLEKTTSNKLRRRLLSEDNLSVHRLVEITSSAELAEMQAAAIEKTDPVERLSRLQMSQNRKYPEQRKQYQEQRNPSRKYPEQTSRREYGKERWRDTGRKFACYGCGDEGHRVGDPVCPAKGKQCKKCNRYNHFESYCFTQKEEGSERKSDWRSSKGRIQVMERKDDSDSDDEYLFGLQEGKRSDVTIKMDNHPVKVLRDSGASINVLDRETYEELKKVMAIKLYPTNVKVYAYNSKKPIELLGMFYSNISYRDTHHLGRVFVTSDKEGGCILGRESALELGLMELPTEINVISTEEKDVKEMLKEHPKITQGLGLLKDVKVEFEIDEEVKPITQHLRRIPFHVRKKVEKKLKELIEMDVIEEVTGATSWVSPIVAVPKGEDVRITIDMRKANTAIKRSHFPIPTFEEILEKFKGCILFSMLDMNHGYHQLELHPNSRYMTTFITHSGLYRYKRLVQGASSAMEAFQYYIGNLFREDELISNICDDILVAGRSKEEHDKNLKKCLETLEENGLTVNPAKCTLGATEVTFYGHVVTPKGIKPKMKTVEAVKRFKEPRSKKEVQSFLGLVNYVSSFIPNLSDETEPLRKLLHKEARWRWDEPQKKAFEKLKTLVTSKLVLVHFDSELETTLITDAGATGLGAVLAQKQKDGTMKAVSYASKSLTAQERRYSQTEKEALGVVWACERFHLYLYGKSFTILSDHEPLKILYSEKGKPSPRILRWGLRLQSYDFKIEYIPGHLNPADIFSNNPVESDEKEKSEEIEKYINSIITYAAPKAITLSEIIDEAEKDATLKQVVKCIRDNDWSKRDDNLQPYYKVRSELTYKANIVLKGERIVYPKALQKRALELAHETHMGMVKTKSLLRDKCWWPGIDSEVEKMISKCIACVSMGDADKAPMGHIDSAKMPGLWEQVHIDFAGPYPSGEFVLGIIDSASRWPDLHVTRSTTSDTVIKYLNKTFATHGYPEKIVTDNAPNLVSAKVEEFCSEYGIKHKKATPYWPQGNSEIERFYRTFGKFVKTTQVEGRCWKKELDKFLIMYRNTPHCTTEVAPAQMLMGRKLKDKIPSIHKEESKIVKRARMINEEKKKKSKEYYDKKRNVRENEIDVGEYVLLKERKKGKYLTKFQPSPVKVIKVRGSAITVIRDEKPVTRNISEVKKIKIEESDSSDREENSEEESEHQSESQSENEADNEGSETENEENQGEQKEENKKEENLELRRSSRSTQNKTPERFKIFIRSTKKK